MGPSDEFMNMRFRMAGMLRGEISRTNWISWGDAYAAVDRLLAVYDVVEKPGAIDEAKEWRRWDGRPNLCIVPDEVQS